MNRRVLIGAALALAAAGPPVLAQQQAGRAAVLVREAEGLYRSGAYAEALKKFEEAFAAGHQDPAALYQAANCYKAALSDETREIEMKRKAIPMLEKEIAAGQAGVASYYYLAAIYIHSLHDPVKGVEAARKGVALVEKPATPLEPPLENVFRAARLHEFLGRDDKAAALDRRFLDAAAVSPVPVERAAVRLSREKLAAHLVKAGEHEEAAAVYAALVQDEPLRDADRHQWGLALLRAGRPAEAAAAWRKAASDEYRTELAYLEKVASRYAQAGKPASSQQVPDAASLTDEALSAKIIEAGAALRAFRQASEAQIKTDSDAAAQEAARRNEDLRQLSAEERRTRWLAKRKEIEADRGKGGDASDSASPRAPSLPVKSEEWLAAERAFFYLMAAYVERGHLIRMYCFQNGLADLVFR